MVLFFCTKIYGSCEYPEKPIKEYFSKNLRILYVEDDGGWKRIFSNLIKKIERQIGQKIDVITASTKEEAVAYYKKFKGSFDLILMDLNFPFLTPDNSSNSLGGVITAQKIRRLGFQGRMIAVTAVEAIELENLQKLYPTLFESWTGKIRNISKLEGILNLY